ncbi:hypothetical protein [Salinarimonas sp.]|uniref:hypothetical protein n=1 Tax=Salinarimonas sp. TaxID=2766526 RepID=UPI0032D970DC
MSTPPFQVQVPQQIFEIAQSGRSVLKSAILALLIANPAGLRSVDVARSLGLESPRGTPQKNYLVWALLQELQREGRVEKTQEKRLVARP